MKVDKEMSELSQQQFIMNALTSKAGQVIKRTKNQDKEMNDSIMKLYEAMNFIQQTQNSI